MQCTEIIVALKSVVLCKAGRKSFWVKTKASSFPSLEITREICWKPARIKRLAILCNESMTGGKLSTASIKPAVKWCLQSRLRIITYQIHLSVIFFISQINSYSFLWPVKVRLERDGYIFRKCCDTNSIYRGTIFFSLHAVQWLKRHMCLFTIAVIF